MNKSTIEEGKMYAFIAYLTLFGTLISFFMNRDQRNEYVNFHVRQALGLGLLYLVIGYIVGGFDSINLSISFWVFFLVLYLYGIYTALTGKLTPLPLLGPLFQRLFKTLG